MASFRLAWVCVLGTAGAIAACSSFSGSDSQGGTSDDAGSSGDGAGGGRDTGTTVDAAAPTDGGSSNTSDAGGDAANAPPCLGGTLVFVDAFDGDHSGWIPTSSCSTGVSYTGSGAVLECTGASEAYNVLTKAAPLPASAAASITIRFVVDDSGVDASTTTHVLTQIINGLATGDNLAFEFDPSGSSLAVYDSQSGKQISIWMGITQATVHTLTIVVPPPASSAQISMALDGMVSAPVSPKMTGQVPQLQIGAFLKADGHAKDRYTRRPHLVLSLTSTRTQRWTRHFHAIVTSSKSTPHRSERHCLLPGRRSDRAPQRW